MVTGVCEVIFCLLHFSQQSGKQVISGACWMVYVLKKTCGFDTFDDFDDGG